MSKYFCLFLPWMWYSRAKTLGETLIEKTNLMIFLKDPKRFQPLCGRKWKRSSINMFLERCIKIIMFVSKSYVEKKTPLQQKGRKVFFVLEMEVTWSRRLLRARGNLSTSLLSQYTIQSCCCSGLNIAIVKKSFKYTALLPCKREAGYLSIIINGRAPFTSLIDALLTLMDGINLPPPVFGQNPSRCI